MTQPDAPRGVSLRDLQLAVKDFAAARGWLPLHNPRNLAEAIVIEAAELLECFQWRTDQSCELVNLDHSTRASIQSELADVVIYLLNLANALEIDALEAVERKLDHNTKRFPPSQA